MGEIGWPGTKGEIVEAAREGWEVVAARSRPDQRADFCRQLATMVGAGMTIVRSLQVMEGRAGDPRLKSFAWEAARTTAQGKPYSSAVEAHPELFSGLVAAIIWAGEAAGRLEGALRQVAEYLERERDLRRSISEETFYPKILLVAAVFAPATIQVIIALIMAGPLVALLVALRMIGVDLLMLAAVVAVAVFTYRRARAREGGARRIDAAKLRIPGIGPIARRLALTRFARGVAAGYRSGLPMAQTVRLAAGVVANRVLEEEVLRAVPYVEDGERVSEALVKGGLTDPAVLAMLRTGEQSGNIDVMMENVADYYEAETETSIKKGLVLIVPVATIIAGIAVLITCVHAYPH